MVHSLGAGKTGWNPEPNAEAKMASAFLRGHPPGNRFFAP